jgi:hypothetical protein
MEAIIPHDTVFVDLFFFWEYESEFVINYFVMHEAEKG